MKENRRKKAAIAVIATMAVLIAAFVVPGVACSTNHTNTNSSSNCNMNTSNSSSSSCSGSHSGCSGCSGSDPGCSNCSKCNPQAPIPTPEVTPLALVAIAIGLLGLGKFAR